MSTPREIATWRLELITPFLDPNLSPKERREFYRRVVRECGTRPLQAGDSDSRRAKRQGRVGRASIRRWVRAYRAQGLKGLEPKLRSDCNSICGRLPKSEEKRCAGHRSSDRVSPSRAHALK